MLHIICRIMHHHFSDHIMYHLSCSGRVGSGVPTSAVGSSRLDGTTCRIGSGRVGSVMFGSGQVRVRAHRNIAGGTHKKRRLFLGKPMPTPPRIRSSLPCVFRALLARGAPRPAALLTWQHHAGEAPQRQPPSNLEVFGLCAF